MKKKITIFSLFLISLTCMIMGLYALSVDAEGQEYFNGQVALVEETLYNSTNTYHVNTQYENGNIMFYNGAFVTDSSSDKFGRYYQYSISYNMAKKYDKSIMDNAQITVLTHGLGAGASAWSNNYSSSNKENVDFAYDPSSLISQISNKVGGAIFREC